MGPEYWGNRISEVSGIQSGTFFTSKTLAIKLRCEQQDVDHGLAFLKSKDRLIIDKSRSRNKRHQDKRYSVKNLALTRMAISMPWLRPSGMRLIKQLEELGRIS